MSELVILGNSVAAIAAVEAFRAIDETSSITIISKEPWGPYSRPLIAEYLAGEKSYEEILYRPETFYNEKGVTKRANCEVVQLNDRVQTVLLSDDQEVPYDRLLIATGSTPVRAKIPGNQREGVFCFWTLGDAQQVAVRAKIAETAVVVGAGLVGQSAVHGLSALGLRVIVIEMLNQILAQNLDYTAAQLVQKNMEDEGIQVLTGRRLKEINGSGEVGDVTSITLDNEQQISCELVIMCTGVRPTIDFLQDSGIHTASGVLVNQYLQTSVPNVYAAGDVAEPYDPVYRMNRIVANLPNAREQGRIAGINLAGEKRAYQGGIAMTSMRYFRIPWISVGAVSCPRESCQEIVGLYSKEEGLYEKLMVEDDTILGAIFVGDLTQSGIITDLIRKEVKLGTTPQYFADKGQFFEYLRREGLYSDMEGPHGYIQWKESIGMEQKYKKKIDKERWRKKERGER